jgi:hypothetical protein
MSSREKNMVFPSGRYPTEDSSDEKDGSFDGGNLGASKRRIDLFLCRRGSSDTHVFTRKLRREVTARLGEFKI